MLLAGDLHLGSRDIESRVDNMAEVSLAKLAWLIDTAIDLRQPIVCTGDFAHTYWASEFRLGVKRELRRFQDAGGLFYVTWGNHDCRDRAPGTGHHMELGQLFYDGYLRELGLGTVLVETGLGPSGVEGIYCLGLPAYTDLSALEPDAGVEMIVCHHYIQAGLDELVVDPPVLKRLYPRLKYILAGHDHAEYPVVNHPCGVKIFRPGSLVRTSIAKDSDRIPQAILLDPGRDTYTSIPCSVAQPYRSVFMAGVHEADRNAEGALSRFTQLLLSGSQASIMDLSSILKAKLAKVPPADRPAIAEDIRLSGFDVS